MKNTVLTLVAVTAAATVLVNAAAMEYKPVEDWLKLPEGRSKLGDMHGDVALSSKGEVYVSVQDPQAGLDVPQPQSRADSRAADDHEPNHGPHQDTHKPAQKRGAVVLLSLPIRRRSGR